MSWQTDPTQEIRLPIKQGIFFSWPKLMKIKQHFSYKHYKHRLWTLIG